jgi:hypothetical protein
MIVTVVLAPAFAPPAVMQSSENLVAAVMPTASATPFGFVLPEFCAVKLGISGLETTHDRIPLVIQPSVVVPLNGTAAGFARKTIPGLPYCTLHCAPAVCP